MRRPRELPLELRGQPFTVGEAAAAGLTRRRTRARDLRIPFRGVRAAAGSVDLAAAYAARMPAGHVFSHTTAAAVWGIPLPRGHAVPLHVAVPPPGREPRMRWVVGHRLGDGIPVGIVRGLPVVAACDAWCQLSTLIDEEALVVARDRLIGWPDPLADVTQVDAAVERFGARRGAPRLRRARARLRPGSASPRETRLRLAVLRAGLPEPECNGLIVLPEGRTHGDLVFRPWRVILEYDGEQHRRDARQFHRDVERLNALALAGWTTIRVSRTTSPSDALTLLRSALAKNSDLESPIPAETV